MADLIAWLDLHAGAVQGLTAISISLLTVVLAAATVWYAKSATDQVDEPVQARLATIQPYLDLVPSSSSGGGIQIGLTNLGVGPPWMLSAAWITSAWS